MSKLLLHEIYQRELTKIAQSEREWRKFLQFSSKIHKYPFDQAVLIYAQNKDVTMVATKNIWEKFNRIILPKSKAIMVTKYEKGSQLVDYLFDISQTEGNALRKPEWKIKSNERSYFEKALITIEGNDLESKIDNLTESKLSGIYLRIEDQFENIINSEKEKNHSEYIRSYIELIINSAQYSVREKCGFEQMEQVNFSFVENIKGENQTHLLGYLVTETTKEVMSEIATIKKEMKLERKDKNDDIQNERRRKPISRAPIEQQSSARFSIREVWQTVTNILTGEQSDQVSGTTNERDIDGENARDRSGSKRQSDRNDQRIGEEQPNTEDRGSILKDTTQKPTESTSRGDSNPGVRSPDQLEELNLVNKEPVSDEETGFYNDIQLELFNDWDTIGSDQTTDDGLSVKDISLALKSGSNIENGKYRIQKYFLTNPPNKEAASFLKKEYGVGGSSGTDSTGGVAMNFDSKGLTLIKGSYLDPTFEVTLTWTEVAIRISALVRAEQYLSNDEQQKFQVYLQDKQKISPRENLSQELNKEGVINSEIINTEVEKEPIVIAAKNYTFNENDDLYVPGEKAKYKNNVTAIRLLKHLEKEKSVVTYDQQKVLAKYVGWGGLANVFNPDNEKWKNEFEELKNILTEKEYREAMESTITAYYTDQGVIREMYRALERFGFENGKILDPAMGTGNFFSTLPNNMSGSQLTGIEIDSITGRLAKQLYPEANVFVQGFESVQLQNNSFDVVIGNIPFNNIKISDPKYDEHNFLIHDYFIAKSLDVVKPGGIIAVITSKGTLDKKNTHTREYIAAKSELLGAVRLPNNAFKAIASTEVTTDILFLKKREHEIDVKDPSQRPDWIDTSHMGRSAIEINRYFINHPKHIIGEMVIDGYYDGARQFKCVPKENDKLIPSLQEAISTIEGSFSAEGNLEKVIEIKPEQSNEIIDAVPGTKNFTYVVNEENVYFCENDKLIPQQLGKKQKERIKGLCSVRMALQDVIDIQSSPYDNSELEIAQKELNEQYDEFVRQYGYINDKVNQKAFYEDDQLPLLLSIEDELEDGTFKKSPIFNKATIRPQNQKQIADTAQEALEMSLNINMQVDLHYMSTIYGEDVETVINELGNQIYLNPERYNNDISYGWEYVDEYLTGNVREKLDFAKLMAKKYPELFSRNVEALESVQPSPLLPGDISYRIGSPWVPKNYYETFMYELLETSNLGRNSSYGVSLEYASFTNTWKVNGKNFESTSVKANSVYGTSRRNGYQIFEDCLNLQDSTVRDPVKYEDRNGNEQTKYVINPKETMVARSKQQEMQEAFRNWLFQDPERSEHLLRIYNEKYNAIRPRTYNGKHLTFPEMNEELALREHQKNVVARILTTGRGLLAHEVGAGKTAAMIAAGMKLKQIGAVKKPMFVVMNHTVDQWAKEFMRFYPGANVLITTKKDFQTQNRKRFVSKIATGDYDAIIIGHSQFEKIPMSKERQENNLRKEINSLSYEIKEAKKQDGKDWSVKQLVIFQKTLEKRLRKLLNENKKDNVINFEDLGVDSLFVDEAHVYKNLYTVTKLTNVAGIGTSSSQRASDLKMKCEYIQEENQGRGIIFATGTPVTNSMSELFVMQRFLQPDTLKKSGLEFFDNWAGTFGEVVSSLEMTPEGSGYRMKSRFAKFHNLPELMNMFNLVADIQTSEMLKLPVPDLDKGKAQVVVSECSPYQKEKMLEFVERSEEIRNGNVDPKDDNMLKLTHEAKLMAIDPRLIDEDAPVDENSKLNKCISNVFRIWKDTEKDKATQMIFCDSGTPKPNIFNVYDEIKDQLIEKGIPGVEIAFIHDAKTDVQREKLFAKVRAGEVRVLIGSTSKVGTGTNVQDRLIAGHHVDCPWRPADLTQRDGRIVRQGNIHDKVSIYRYVTKGTFDGYLWQIQEQKLRYISQVMTGKNISRSCDDTDETVLTAAEVKAVATDNPLLLEKMSLDNDVNRLKLLKNRWSNEKAIMERNLASVFPNRISQYERKIKAIEADQDTVYNHTDDEGIELKGMTFFEEKEAGQAMKAIVQSHSTLNEATTDIGKYKGLNIFARKSVFDDIYIGLKGESSFEVPLKNNDTANIQRLIKIVDKYNSEINSFKKQIEEVKEQIKSTELEVNKPFAYEYDLDKLLKRQTDLNLKMEFQDQAGKSDNLKIENKESLSL